jgi:hypothetical protein
MKREGSKVEMPALAALRRPEAGLTGSGLEVDLTRVEAPRQSWRARMVKRKRFESSRTTWRSLVDPLLTQRGTGVGSGGELRHTRRPPQAAHVDGGPAVSVVFGAAGRGRFPARNGL